MTASSFLRGVEIVSAPAESPRLFTPVDYQRSFDHVWVAKPTAPVHAANMYSWLWRMGERAVFLRRYRLGEAAARAITTRWPHDSSALVVLSQSVGQQGRFAEALEIIVRARPSQGPRGVETIRVDHLHAAWLWHLGRKEEAADLIEASGRPKDAPVDETAWLAMRAWYRAATDGSGPTIQRHLTEALKTRDGGLWRHLFLRDAAFDHFRKEPWFITLLGEKSANIPAPANADDERRLISELPEIGDDAAARAALASAFTALAEKRWDDALADANRGLEQQPILVELVLTKSLALIAKDDYPAAMDAMRKISYLGMTMANPTVDLRLLMKTSLGVLTTMLADARMDRSKSRRAALALIIQAQGALEVRDLRGALTLLEGAESWAPNLPEVWNSRGIVYARLNDPKRAEACYRQALATSERYGDPAANIGSLCLEQCRFPEALEWFDRAAALGMAPSYVEALRAQALALVGRVDEAVAIADRLVAAAEPPPRRAASTFRHLAYACAGLGRHQDAERFTRRAIALNPEQSDLWTQLSGDLGRQGRYQEAWDATQRALEERFDDAFDAQLAQACWAWKLGRQAEALAIVARVAKPENEQHLPLFHACRAIFAAVSENTAMLIDELTKKRAVDTLGRTLMWVKIEHFFVRYRDEEWFRALIAQWEAAVPKPADTGKSAEPRL